MKSVLRWTRDTGYRFIITLSISIGLVHAETMEPAGRLHPGKAMLGLFLFSLILLVVSYTGPSPANCGMTYDTFGDITIVNKPVPAVVIDSDEIPVGEAATFTYNLAKGKKYHVYLTGEWADPSAHNTDYDVYVYRVFGGSASLLSTHTEAAGLPEQVSNDGRGQYFIPGGTGNYWFTVRNDALESSAAEPATFIVIEQVETDEWLSKKMEGKVNEEPVKDTTWAYQFISSAPRIRLFIDVPRTLDMYEARLYVMGNPTTGKGALLDGAPIAWEPGLRGEVKGVYGGFNLDPKGFRHYDAMASCERSGDDMVIDYEAPVDDELLYHLVLIAEYGTGYVDFVLQTDFESPVVQLVDSQETVVARDPVPLEIMVEDASPITSVDFTYSKDGGESWRNMNVEYEGDGNYSVLFPGQGPGTSVEYVFSVEDAMGNMGEAAGNFTAIGIPRLDLSIADTELLGSEDVDVWGLLFLDEREVSLIYTNGEQQHMFPVETDSAGRFNHTFKPTSTGNWTVHASYAGDVDYMPVETDPFNFTVTSLSSELTCTVDNEKVEFGKKITISGVSSLGWESLTIEVLLKTTDHLITLRAETSADGVYGVEFEPDSKGLWMVKTSISGDGLVYEDADSESAAFNVVNPSLTTTVLRLPSTVVTKAGGLMKPPYLYVLVGFGGIAGGGLVFYLMRRE